MRDCFGTSGSFLGASYLASMGPTTLQNSSKFTLPSPSVSASFIILETVSSETSSPRPVPSTRSRSLESSSLEIKPSLFSSKVANCFLSSSSYSAESLVDMASEACATFSSAFFPASPLASCSAFSRASLAAYRLCSSRCENPFSEFMAEFLASELTSFAFA